MLGKWKFTPFIHNLYQEGTMKNFQNKIAEVYDRKFKELRPCSGGKFMVLGKSADFTVSSYY